MCVCVTIIYILLVKIIQFFPLSFCILLATSYGESRFSIENNSGGTIKKKFLTGIDLCYN